jgi:uncharacterized protein (TIGR00255 family)
MTGFGVGEAPAPAGRLVVEVRAVNHRFLDVRVRSPRELSDLVAYAEQLGRERLSRGRVEIAIRVEDLGSGGISIDTARAKAAFRALVALRDEIAPEAEVPLALLASVPDLFAATGERERDAMRAACREAFERAVGALEQMREAEGTALGADLRQRLSTVRGIAERIGARSASVVDSYQRRLRARLARLLPEGAGLDSGRIEQEIALLADRCDITEELTRLGSHCAQFEHLSLGAEACGRRLDFLLQEMVREVNTVGSKAQDAEIAHLVVEMKSELERMREQVQNIE